MNSSLQSGISPNSFKVATVKSWVKKNTLDPLMIITMLFSNIPFLSKDVEEVLLKQ